jgi:hypothetical protein
LGSFQDQPSESTVESVRRAGKEAAEETVDLVTGVGVLLGTALGLPMGDVGNTNEVQDVAALSVLCLKVVLLTGGFVHHRRGRESSPLDLSLLKNSSIEGDLGTNDQVGKIAALPVICSKPVC